MMTMIGQRTAWESRSFQALVDHLASFGEPLRHKLATLYGAPDASAKAIAARWTLDPEAVREVVAQKVRSAQLHTLLEDLVLDHDLPLRVEWSERKHLQQLVDLGLLRPLASRGRGIPRTVSMPGALAAILSPTVTGMRPSLPIIMGRMERDEVAAIAKQHGVEEGPLLVMMYELRDHFEEPDTLEGILDMLPEPEWLGGALMAIELGGMCYWQEIFGTGVEQPEENIVPLMRDFERRQEQDIALTLAELGLIFRLEGDPSGYPMLAIPEELWHALWTLGRGWLMEWVTHTIDALVDNGARKLRSVAASEPLQHRLKWLLCEARLERFAYPVSEVLSEQLSQKAGVSAEDCAAWIEQATSLELLAVTETAKADDRLEPELWLEPADEHLEVLELGRAPFARHALRAWCMGGFGEKSDRHAAPAIGLDDAWRQQVLELELGPYDALLPAWVHGEGMEPQMTGTGYLRNLSTSTPELLMLELGLVNSYIWSTKVLWLDLLSLLEDGRWYPLGLLQELLQLVAALTLFNHLAHILEHPAFSHYLPVQRASFLSDPMHVTSFDDWAAEVVEDVMVPLGVAAIEDGLVMLSTRDLRVESPTGMPDELRVESLRELIGDDEFEFVIPESNGPKLSIAAVHEPREDGSLPLDSPLPKLFEWLEGKRIVRYEDGRLILD